MKSQKFAERIEAIRLEYGFDDSEMAKAIGLKSEEDYELYKQGVLPSDEKIEFIGRWFDISPNYLKGYDEVRTTYTSYSLNVGN